jgi:hypothetical protein
VVPRGVRLAVHFRKLFGENGVSAAGSSCQSEVSLVGRSRWTRGNQRAKSQRATASPPGSSLTVEIPDLTEPHGTALAKQSKSYRGAPRQGKATKLAAYHGLQLVILTISTLALFRTWIGPAYPGGTDSALLYSALAFYKGHGLQVFTIWLPTPLGQVSQYSMYWLLSMLTVIFRSILVTYKLAAIAIALTSAVGMYAISWSWSKSRVGALAAAIFYSFSPMSVDQGMSGHLDVLVSMAVGPLMVWSADRLLRTGSKRAAVGLGLCASALLLLTTGQAAYWLPVVGAIVLARLLISFKKIVSLLRHARWGFVLAAGAFVAASAVQLGPWLLGAYAPFAGSGGLAIESLAIHEKYSLSFGQALVGVPGEIWLIGSRISLVPFGSWIFIVPQAFIIAFGFMSACAKNGWFSRALLVLAVAAWVMAAGPLGPAGSLYTALWEHVVYFRELRVPSRWQMISSFSVASMLAISIGISTRWLCTRLSRLTSVEQSGKRLRRSTRRVSIALASCVTPPREGMFNTLCYFAVLILATVSLLALNSGSILIRSLPTIQPPSAYVAAYSALARDPGDWRVLTVPVGQAWMAGPSYGDYQGVETDLGYMGSLYNGDSTVDNGGWDPRASQFINFLSALINQGADRHLAGILGAVGIKYVVINPEDAVSVPWGQASLLRSQSGFKVLSSKGGVVVLKNLFAQPGISQPTSACVIAGGYSVLEDLSEDPAFSFSKTALYFADQVVKTSGWSTLVGIIAKDHCLIVGPGGQAELRVLRNSMASVSTVSIAPDGWTTGQVNPLLDSQADAASWVSIPAGQHLVWAAHAPSAGSYRVWLRIMRQPNAGPVPITINGRAAGTVNPATPASVGFEWRSGRVLHLNRGLARVTLRGLSRGVSSEVTEIALVREGGSPRRLPLDFPRSWLITDRGPLDPGVYRHVRVEWSLPVINGPWRGIESVKAKNGRGRVVTLSPTSDGHPTFSTAYARMPRAINPVQPLAFRFQGTGSGATFSLGFQFRNGSQKSFSFVDTTKRPRWLLFTPQEGGPAFRRINDTNAKNPFVYSFRQVPDWRNVRGLKLYGDSTLWQVGAIRIGGPFHVRLPHSLPYFVGRFPEASGSQSMPETNVKAHVGPSEVSLQGLRNGILDFSESYDPQWRLTGAHASAHTVELGFENSYLVTNSRQQARLGYGPAVVGVVGTFVSCSAWFLGIGSLIMWPLCRRAARHQKPGSLLRRKLRR